MGYFDDSPQGDLGDGRQQHHQRVPIPVPVRSGGPYQPLDFIGRQVLTGAARLLRGTASADCRPKTARDVAPTSLRFAAARVFGNERLHTDSRRGGL